MVFSADVSDDGVTRSENNEIHNNSSSRFGVSKRKNNQSFSEKEKNLSLKVHGNPQYPIVWVTQVLVPSILTCLFFGEVYSSMSDSFQKGFLEMSNRNFVQSLAMLTMLIIAGLVFVVAFCLSWRYAYLWLCWKSSSTICNLSLGDLAFFFAVFRSVLELVEFFLIVFFTEASLFQVNDTRFAEMTENIAFLYVVLMINTAMSFTAHVSAKKYLKYGILDQSNVFACVSKELSESSWFFWIHHGKLLIEFLTILIGIFNSFAFFCLYFTGLQIHSPRFLTANGLVFVWTMGILLGLGFHECNKNKILRTSKKNPSKLLQNATEVEEEHEALRWIHYAGEGLSDKRINELLLKTQFLSKLCIRKKEINAPLQLSTIELCTVMKQSTRLFQKYSYSFGIQKGSLNLMMKVCKAGFDFRILENDEKKTLHHIFQGLSQENSVTFGFLIGVVMASSSNEEEKEQYINELSRSFNHSFKACIINLNMLVKPVSQSFQKVEDCIGKLRNENSFPKLWGYLTEKSDENHVDRFVSLTKKQVCSSSDEPMKHLASVISEISLEFKNLIQYLQDFEIKQKQKDSVRRIVLDWLEFINCIISRSKTNAKVFHELNNVNDMVLAITKDLGKTWADCRHIYHYCSMIIYHFTLHVEGYDFKIKKEEIISSTFVAYFEEKIRSLEQYPMEHRVVDPRGNNPCGICGHRYSGEMFSASNRSAREPTITSAKVDNYISCKPCLDILKIRSDKKFTEREKPFTSVALNINLLNDHNMPTKYR